MVKNLIALVTLQLQSKPNDPASKQLEYKQDYFSIIGYANMKGNTTITMTEARALSYKCKKMSVEKSIVIRKTPDERFGFVNSYRVDILDDVQFTMA